MCLGTIARDIEPLLRRQGRLIVLPSDVDVTFAGDVHGDIDAVHRVLSRASALRNVVVFLGDIVDRGPASRECLMEVLRAKRENPERVYLLMGNHEAWGQARFRPADFWESLPGDEVRGLSPSLLQLPFAAWHGAGVLALHGALPDLESRADIEAISLGSAPWRAVTWGDWVSSASLRNEGAGRPTFGLQEFSERAARLGVRVLVRSHQPDAPLYLYEDRCLTLFTSCAYGAERRIALLPRGREIGTARDLDVITI